MTTPTSTWVDLKSDLLDPGENPLRRVRPLGQWLIVERPDSTRTYGRLVLPNQDVLDLQCVKILSVSSKVKCATRKYGRVAPGQMLLHVRVVGRNVDDRNARSLSNKRLATVPEEHCLAIIDDDAIHPVDNRILIRKPDDAEHHSGLVMFGMDKLSVVSSEILAIGPEVKDVTVGRFGIHPRVYGVPVEDIDLKKKFGPRLSILRENELSAEADTAGIEGQAEAGVEL